MADCWSDLNGDGDDMVEKIAKNSADWSDLNGDMVEKIAKKIDSYSDYLRFSAICVGWRSSLVHNPPNHFQQRFPCLLVPHEMSSLLKNPTPIPTPCLIPDVVHLPPSDALSVIGFSKGWLIAVEKEGLAIKLINPFTTTTDQCQRQIHRLPPIYTFPDVLDYQPDRVGEEFVVRKGFITDVCTLEDMSAYYIHKVVLSSSLPNTNDFTVMALYGESNKLAFCKYGDTRWTCFDHVFFEDVIFHNDKFYAVDCKGQIFVMSDLDSSPNALCIIIPSKRMDWFASHIYLAEWSGDLFIIGRSNTTQEEIDTASAEVSDYLVVARNLQWIQDIDYSQTFGFGIFNLNLHSRSPSEIRLEWEKLCSLDNQVLFIGANESMFLPARNFPGCKGNCIYFCDNLDGSNVGVFDYHDKDVYPILGYTHPILGYAHDPDLFLSFLPIWVVRHNA